MIQPNDVILFQGDSITNKGRDHAATEPNTETSLGCGYVFLCASAMLARYPQSNLRIYNKGISGNKIPDLLNRWQRDALDLKPTLISIMVGVNDTGHRFVPTSFGVPVPEYEKGYRQLLDQTQAALPGVRLVLCEPFTIKYGVVNDKWEPEMTERRAVVKRLAQDYGTPYVEYQTAFDRACRQAPPAYWTHDGVHPTIAGHGLMAQTWMQTVLGAS